MKNRMDKEDAKIRAGLDAGIKSPRVIRTDRRTDAAEASAAPDASAADDAESDGPIIVWASEIAPRKVAWLWPGRIPLGKLTTFAGVGGLGKTFVLCDIIARITRGLPWPDGAGEARLGKALFISGEDEPDDTLVPRLIESGGDRSRVCFLKTEIQNTFTLADLKTLDKARDQMGPEASFVAIDPPTAYLGGVDDHKNADLRGLLAPLAKWAAENRLAVVFNTHLTKPQATKTEAMMRVMGSVAWVNAVRAAHMFARDPNDPSKRFFCGMKLTNGRERKGLAYRIVETSDEMARVEWLGEIDVTADEALCREKKKRDVVAADWLASLFEDANDLPSSLIWERMKSETTLSRNALLEAKEFLGIKASQLKTGWQWTWPPHARERWQQETTTADEDVFVC